jgi:hypothetical protein
MLTTHKFASADEALCSADDLAAVPPDVQLCVDSGQPEQPLAAWGWPKAWNRVLMARDLLCEFFEAPCHRQLDKLECEEGCDPYYDPLKVQMIGRTLLFMDSLSFLLEMDDVAPVMDYRGHQCGELAVNIKPYVLNKRTFGVDEGADALHFDASDWIFPNLDLDAPEERLSDRLGQPIRFVFRVRGARGLPLRLCHQNHVSFQFYLNEALQSTHRCAHSSINPHFSHLDSNTLVVTEELIEYLESESLEFEVWGSTEAAIVASPTIGFKQAQIHDGTIVYSREQAQHLAATTGVSADKGELAHVGAASALTPAELDELNERVEDSEREVDLVMSEVQSRREAAEKTALEISDLHNRLHQLEEDGQAEYTREIERLTIELQKSNSVERSLRGRIREMEEAAAKPKSKFCAIM